MGGSLIEAISIRLVKFIVAQTNYLAYIIIFTKAYYYPNFFNGLYNIINFIKDWADIIKPCRKYCGGLINGLGV